MELLDSRRLTGPNLICPVPGAVIDVEVEDALREQALAVWSDHARALQRSVGWVGEDAGVHIRRFEGGASLVLVAPIDGLYAACEINECAWQRAVAALGGEGPATSAAEDVARLRELVAEESRPRLLDLARRAESVGVTFLWDDDAVSVGTGTGSITWPVDQLPVSDAVAWSEVTDVPTVLVTGTNGKSTTVRMLAAIVKAGGRTPGFSSTDGLWIGNECIDSGDYSGPGGARTVLRERRTDVALLETARGGLLRRGLGVNSANAVALLNVAEDHMGEYGVQVMDDLVEAKFMVRRAVNSDRPIVLNADDPLVVEGARKHLQAPVIWFSLEADNPIVVGHLREGGTACVAEGGYIRYCCGDSRVDVVEICSVPATMNGHALFNIANAMAAVSLAMAIDLPVSVCAAGLQAFQSDPETNPGRCNVFEIGGVTAVVDFAHNAHGMRAFLQIADAMPGGRRLVVIGMAGDRTDEGIREFVQAVWSVQPDCIVLKEMGEHLRGREPGAVLDLMTEELALLGAPSDRVVRAGSEIEATRYALGWARRDDLLLLSVQAERDAVIELLRDLGDSGWRPGEPVSG
ncbi:MAG: Mur ligase family protein [Planctomycetota bacterium]|nr:Mur ligase family protein [Planctomycetota bacterium]